jgi:hypothetical protein
VSPSPQGARSMYGASIQGRVYHMFGDDIATYVSLHWLKISKFPFDMMYPYRWTTHMQKISPLSIRIAEQ